jgi:hypothetical protein
MAELTKQDVLAITSIFAGQENNLPNIWPLDKTNLLKAVALSGFDIREAAEAFLSDVRERYGMGPNDAFECAYMQRLSFACKAAEAIGRGAMPKELADALIAAMQAKPQPQPSTVRAKPTEQARPLGPAPSAPSIKSLILEELREIKTLLARRG